MKNIVIALLVLLAIPFVSAGYWCNNTDLDQDHDVDDTDFVLFKYYWSDECMDEECDLRDYNGDGFISLADFTFFGQNYGRTDCEGPEVPEFGTVGAALALVGAGYFYYRKRN